MKIEIPANINQQMKEYTIEEGPRGLSGAGIYRLSKDASIYYLKVALAENRFINELEAEYKILKWLKGKLPAPEVISFEKERDRHYLLMTAVEGNTLEELYNNNMPTEEIVKIYAESLKCIHSIDTKGCPKDVVYEAVIADIRHIIELGIDLDNMEDEYKGLSSLQLYEKLLSLEYTSDEIVFVHGDYCLDNIIIKDNKLSGVIDVGRGGLGDRYKDIALAVRNIKGDFGDQWLNLFFEVYGITNPDWDKVEFYTIVDEFY